MDDKLEQLQNDTLVAAVNDDAVKDIYFNGFQAATGNGDILLILNRNNKAAYKVNLSFTMAKTLSEKLGFIIAEIERQAESRIMTTDDINEKMVKPK